MTPTLPRRPLLAALLAAPALAALAPGRAGAQGTDLNRAVAFIQATGQDLTAAINGASGNAASRRAQVAGILRRAVDVEGVGRFVLGRWWRTASAAEQQEYLRLFDETLVRNLSSRFGEYQGVRFSLGRSQQRTEEDALVNTVIERPGSPAFALDWRVSDVGGQPRIVDVIAEGTSLRLTQRSEYSAVVQRGNGQVSALLAAMRGQIDQLAARESGR